MPFPFQVMTFLREPLFAEVWEKNELPSKKYVISSEVGEAIFRERTLSTIEFNVASILQLWDF